MSLGKARALVGNSELFESIIEFNSTLSSSLKVQNDTDMVQLMLHDMAPDLYLFRKMSASDSFIPFYDVADRLCLIDDATLKTLSMYLGAACMHKSLLNVLFKSDRELLFSFLDKKIYDYTLSFMRYTIPRSLTANKVTDVLEIKDEISKRGYAILLSLEAVIGDERLKEFFTNKITALYNGSIEPCDIESSDTLYKLCIQILTQEIDEKWLRYFA